jgi:hypothetical protein
MDILLTAIISIELGIGIGALITDRTWKHYCKLGVSMKRSDGFTYHISKVISYSSRNKIL